jgi:hypothetical protein
MLLFVLIYCFNILWLPAITLLWKALGPLGDGSSLHRAGHFGALCKVGACVLLPGWGFSWEWTGSWGQRPWWLLEKTWGLGKWNSSSKRSLPSSVLQQVLLWDWGLRPFFCCYNWIAQME